MRFAHTNPGRPTDERFHETRREARETALAENEFTDEERVDYVIDQDGTVYPLGGIPSSMRDDNYRVEDPVSGEEYDYRDAHPYI